MPQFEDYPAHSGEEYSRPIMKMYKVYLKTRSDGAVVVKAERQETKDGWLRFFVGDDEVAAFQVDEVQGWRE